MVRARRRPARDAARRGRRRARRPRATMSPRSVTSRRRRRRRNAACAASRRALGRAHALDLGRDQRRDHAQQRRPAARRAGAHAQPADHARRRRRSSMRLDAGAVGHQRLLVGGERAATASTGLVRSISTRQASSARAAARTTSGRPAPDSTASVIASSALEVDGSAASCRPKHAPDRLGRSQAVVVPEHARPPASAPADERRQHVDVRNERRDALPQPPVRPPGGHEDQARPRRRATRRAATPTTR